MLKIAITPVYSPAVGSGNLPAVTGSHAPLPRRIRVVLRMRRNYTVAPMNHIKNTIIRGIIFLVPFIIGFLLLVQIYNVMMLIAVPLGDVFAVQGTADAIVTNLFALLLVLLACYLAGLVAKSALMRRAFRALDRRLSLLIPGYAYFGSVFRDFDPGLTKGFRPAVIRVNDMRQLGFWVEDIDDVDCIVYLPMAPEARSGTVAIVEKTRVTELDTRFIETVDILNRFGSGSAEKLRNHNGA